MDRQAHSYSMYRARIGSTVKIMGDLGEIRVIHGMYIYRRSIKHKDFLFTFVETVCILYFRNITSYMSKIANVSYRTCI